jgi:hypothetical protein
MAEADWRSVHHLEQILCFLTTGALLDGQIDHRLIEAEQKSLPWVASRRALFAALSATPPPADAEAQKQSLLFSIVTDLQLRAQQLYQIRRMRLRAVRTVSWIAAVVILLVGVPLIAYIAHFMTIGAERRTWISDFVGSFPNFGLFTAISFGALGALFSRFLILQRSEGTVPLDEAATYYGSRYIFLRVLIGTVAAIIVYFFLASGLISGGLAPDIQRLTYIAAQATDDASGIRTYLATEADSAMVPSKDMALLIVWAFLAGFSEFLVPNLLNTTSERAQAQRGVGPTSPEAGVGAPPH